MEFCDREELKDKPITEMVGYGSYPVPPGAWSDDTSMSLAALDSLANGSVDFEVIMDNFVKWCSCDEYTPTGSPWYMMPLGFIIMLPLVGIAEEVGWRGFLQPELENKFPFPIATSITAVIWYVWHLPLWAMPSSNHYGDSLIGFAIMIFVWAFVAAAIYKATKSTLACSIYHSFINSIGAIYDWNALFDAYPKTNEMLLYFGVVFVLAIFIWVLADKKEKGSISKAK